MYRLCVVKELLVLQVFFFATKPSKDETEAAVRVAECIQQVYHCIQSNSLLQVAGTVTDK